MKPTTETAPADTCAKCEERDTISDREAKLNNALNELRIQGMTGRTSAAVIRDSLAFLLRTGGVVPYGDKEKCSRGYCFICKSDEHGPDLLYWEVEQIATAGDARWILRHMHAGYTGPNR